MLDGEVLEVKCRSGRCGAKKGVVVLHRFNIRTGKMVDTLRFRDPAALG